MGMSMGRAGLTWNLVVVSAAETMVLRIAVEEHAELQERVWTVLDARHHSSRGEGGLLDVAVEVFRVLGQAELAEFLHLE
jgi:hypothetical protein